MLSPCLASSSPCISKYITTTIASSNCSTFWPNRYRWMRCRRYHLRSTKRHVCSGQPNGAKRPRRQHQQHHVVMFLWTSPIWYGFNPVDRRIALYRSKSQNHCLRCYLLTSCDCWTNNGIMPEWFFFILAQLRAVWWLEISGWPKSMLRSRYSTTYVIGILTKRA